RPPHHNPVETDPHPSPRLRSPRPQNRRVGRTRCARRVTSMTCAHKHRKFGLGACPALRRFGGYWRLWTRVWADWRGSGGCELGDRQTPPLGELEHVVGEADEAPFVAQQAGAEGDQDDKAKRVGRQHRWRAYREFRASTDTARTGSWDRRAYWGRFRHDRRPAQGG